MWVTSWKHASNRSKHKLYLPPSAVHQPLNLTLNTLPCKSLIHVFRHQADSTPDWNLYNIILYIFFSAWSQNYFVLSKVFGTGQKHVSFTRFFHSYCIMVQHLSFSTHTVAGAVTVGSWVVQYIHPTKYAEGSCTKCVIRYTAPYITEQQVKRMKRRNGGILLHLTSA